MGFLAALVPGWGKLIAVGLALALVAGLSFAAYRYVSVTRDRLVAAQTEAAAARIALKAQADSIDTLEGAIRTRDALAAGFQRSLDALTAEARASRARVADLDALLARHDLARLAAAKPGLIESRVNRASEAMLRELEEASRVEP